MKALVASILLFSLPVLVSAGQDAPTKSVIRVHVTSQSYVFLQPWRKTKPSSRRGLGTCVRPNQFLVTADLVRNATFVELERVGEPGKSTARVKHVDYLTNLALVEALDASFTSKHEALALTDVKAVGDATAVWQFENNGTPVLGEGRIKAIELGMYGCDSAMLIYKLDIKLAPVGSSFVLPVLAGGKLIGLSMSYTATGQSMTVIPAMVISRFLTDLDDGEYQGFPRAGFSFSNMEDPQLRKYAKLNGKRDGVYISDVGPGGAAELAGLEAGDVLLSVAGFDIDRRGEYVDPDFDRQSIAHLTTTRHVSGDVVPLTVLRDGEFMELSMTLKLLALDEYPSLPFLYDRPPRFVIVGGFVFQELCREMLKSWGGDWPSAAPRRLVYYERNQWDLIGPDKRLVILTRVLPTPGNIGYQHFRFEMVKSVNDAEIQSLEDLVAAFQATDPEFQTIRFRHNSERIVIDTASLGSETKLVQMRYRIPRMAHLGEE